MNYILHNKINIVFTVGYGDSMFWGRLAALITRVGVVYCSLHTFPEIGGVITLPNRLIDRITTRYLPCTAMLVPILQDKYHINPKRITVFHDGIDENLLNNMDIKESIEINYIVKEYATGKSKKVTLVQVGTLVYYKNQKLSISAFDKLFNNLNIQNIQLIFIGDGEDRELLENQISIIKLKKNIILLGHLTQKETLGILSQADIVLSTSISEAFPNNLLEAGLLKKPIIASDVGGVSEIVVHNETGFIFPSDNVDQLIKYLQILINSEKKRHRFGKRGFNHVVSNFTIGHKVKQFENMVKSDFNEL